MAIDCATRPPPSPTTVPEKNDPKTLIFDSSVARHLSEIPKEFIWPDDEKPSGFIGELSVPLIDLGAFLSGDPVSESQAAKLVGEACEKHGFFLVVNHGVDRKLISDAQNFIEYFFGLPLPEKQKAQRIVGEHCGYASSFVGRFASKLPWKETLSFQYTAGENSGKVVEDYISKTLGQKFEQFGRVYQEYGDAMNKLSLDIMELLGMSLGIKRSHFREYFEENDSIMRLNYYPPCQKPDQALGTGPHCDPTSLTILHQDQVGGLQVFVDDQWRSIAPNFDAFVINIGDTFAALTNGKYKSCLHRAVVNREVARKTLTFFLSPRTDKVVKPPSELVNNLTPRIYPDFTWQNLLEFTQKHYRADDRTLQVFSKWIQQKTPDEIEH